MIVLSQQDVSSILTMPVAINLVGKAMIATSAGKATLPQRTAMDVGEPNLLGIMPGALKDAGCHGAKLISLYPNNPAKGHSSHLGMMVLFESEFGRPTAIMDAGVLTAIRTAAASAVATNALARENVKKLVLVGAGEQAEFHLEAMQAVRNIEQVCVVGRDQSRLEKFVTRAAEKYCEIKFETSLDAQQAVKGADIICTVTSSQKTVLEGDWVKDGCHVNAVGASVPTMREIDEILVVKSSLFVDYRPSALAQAQDIIAALENGKIKKSHIIGGIGEVLAGEVRGRESDEEITLYRSLGIAAQDLICAQHVLEIANEKGLGTIVNL